MANSKAGRVCGAGSGGASRESLSLLSPRPRHRPNDTSLVGSRTNTGQVMKPIAKVGLVIGGYAGAALVALAAFAVYTAVTEGPDRQASAGMYAFADGVLFLGAFGVAAVPPTATALFFLRPHRAFWRALAVLAIAVAATALAATASYLEGRAGSIDSTLSDWSVYAVLRILAAPFLGVAFLLSGLFAPRWSFRVPLLFAAGVEGAVFLYIAVLWINA